MADFNGLLRSFLQDCAEQGELPELAGRASALLAMLEKQIPTGDPSVVALGGSSEMV